MTHDEVDNQWKYQAPYLTHKPGAFISRYEGRCFCGQVTYQVNREQPLDVKYCHCMTCQLQHAAPFQWAAIFHKEDISFTQGHHGLTWYNPQSRTIGHQLPCTVLCRNCGTHIMDEGPDMIFLFATLIKFQSHQDRMNFEPTCHMFYSWRTLDVVDGKPKWSGLNNNSKLIDEFCFEDEVDTDEKPLKIEDILYLK